MNRSYWKVGFFAPVLIAVVLYGRGNSSAQTPPAAATNPVGKYQLTVVKGLSADDAENAKSLDYHDVYVLDTQTGETWKKGVGEQTWTKLGSPTMAGK